MTQLSIKYILQMYIIGTIYTDIYTYLLEKLRNTKF